MPIKILLLVLGLLIAGAAWWKLLRVVEAANGADWGGKWLNRLDGLNRIFCRRFHRLQHEALKLPPTGGVLVASNHISGLDPLLMIAASPRPLRFLIAREYYDYWWLRWLVRAMGYIPVERIANPRAALYAARRALEAGEVVALFPHGHIHLEHHPPIKLKRGIISLAQMTGVPIYPMQVSGVRGRGRTVMAVWLRSHARVCCYSPLHCQERDDDACLQELWEIITPGSGLLV